MSKVEKSEWWEGRFEVEGPREREFEEKNREDYRLED
jgi:hypothetical protein